MTRLNPDNKQKEVCNFLGCGYDQLMKYVRTGVLDGTYYRIGRRVLFVKEKLEIWQENQIRLSASSENGVLKELSKLTVVKQNIDG